MATIIAADAVVHQPITDYERQVIEANRRMAEIGVVRCDYQHAPDGLRAFREAVKKLEKDGLS